MPAFEFKIGTSVGSMTAMQNFNPPLKAPHNEYFLYADSLDLADGSERGVGAPLVTWHWGFLTGSQRAVLRTFCSGKSARVFIRTRLDTNEYDDYDAIMRWPIKEDRDAGRVLDFTLEFRKLVTA